MSMKLNELLSGRDVNTIDANKLWHECRKAGIESSEYGSWIPGPGFRSRDMFSFDLSILLAWPLVVRG